MKKLLIAAAFAASLSSCYVEEMPSSREYQKLKEKKEGLKISDRNACRVTNGSACIWGNVVASPDIYLEGKRYFDANDLGRKFKELLALKTESGEKLSTEDYEVEVHPEITNDNFLRDFEVYVKGQKVVADRANERGAFRINDLPEGDYDIRVQKDFVLKLTQKGAGTEEKVEEKTYCFAIYAEDVGVTLFKGDSVYKALDNFRLQMLDKECKQETSDASISL